MLTIIVPTFNESGNVGALAQRLSKAVATPAEILFVDDSTDDTPETIEALTRVDGLLPVRLLHRSDPVGGLAGAVTAGINQARGERIAVMDGDLQHPPELVPELVARLDDADLVVASRYAGEGDASGLSSNWRRTVSSLSTLLAKCCFPKRVGRVCTDPMTGFFAFRRESVDLARLRPRGFKILLEILARHDLAVVEVPFLFGDRNAGDSKASWRNGASFLYQLASLRMGRMSRFAAVGALGTLVNLGVLWVLLGMGWHYLAAAVVAAEVSIAHNFAMQERFVYRDLRATSDLPWHRRLLLFFAFNNIEAVLRLPALALLVSVLAFHPVPAQALLLLIAFLVRFFFTTAVVYGSKRPPLEYASAHQRSAGSGSESPLE